MYPTKKDCNNAILIRFVTKDKGHMIRSFFTENPKMYLEMYYFMFENEMEVQISDEVVFKGEGKEEIDDPYNDNWGTIEDIRIGSGGKTSFPVIDVIVSVQDFS